MDGWVMAPKANRGEKDGLASIFFVMYVGCHVPSMEILLLLNKESSMLLDLATEIPAVK